MSKTALKPVETQAPTEINNAIYESLALRGDLSGLTPEDKTKYYASLCERLGLDPTTQPFAPLKLSGKEILYPTRGATDQLARIHNVNRRILAEAELRGVYIVTVEASLPNGRTEQSKGAVALGNLQGEAFANAIMKAETKAKRRATLAILGLGMLDETEVESITESQKIAYPTNSEPSAGYKQIGTPAENAPALPAAVEEPTARELKLRKIGGLCRDLNRAGDSTKWGKATIDAFLEQQFMVKNGVDDLTEDDLEAFAIILEEKLAILGQQADSEAAAEAA